MSNNITLDPAL
jgi:hypothetical protein